MVSTVLALVTVIQDMGLNQATIQRQRISHAQISAMFWLTGAVSFALAVFVALCGPAVAWFFGDPRLIGLTAASGSLVFLGGSQSQQFALLNRELRFKALAGLDVLSVTTSAIVGITLAWQTSSYWALFAAGLASTLVNLVCVWTLCSFRPGRPSFEGDFNEIVHFGSSISGFNIVNYFARNADNLLIGRFWGSAQLGLYDRAYRLLLFPIEQIRSPLARVMLPALTRLLHDPERYRRVYTEWISLLMIATQPGLVFLIIFALDVFRILYGPHWLPAAPIFQWLGICGLQQIATSTAGWLFISQGRGGDFFKLGVFTSVVTVVTFIIGLPWGPLGVAIAYTIGNYLVHMPATALWAGRSGPVGVRDMISCALPHVAATCVSVVVLLGAAVCVSPQNVIECAGIALLSYAVYSTVVLLFPDKRRILGANFRALVAMIMPVSGRA
jgi:PST family polysaccharide transporter